MGAKGVEAEETRSILSDFIEGDIKMNQTITWVKQARMIKTMIPREKSWKAKGLEQRDDVRTIFHPKAANFNPNLSNVQLTGAQAVTFNDAEVFVEDIHAARCRCADFSIKASLASLTTSAIASWAMRPLYAATIWSLS